MHPRPGVLIETVTPPEGASNEWIDWYDRYRLAPRSELAGVVAARRGTAVIGTVPHVIVYDLADFLVPLSSAWQSTDRESGEPPEDVAAAAAPEATLYRQIFSLHGGDYVPEPTPLLHTAVFEVPSRNQDEFNDWYNSEHVAFVKDVVDGYLNCRRFQGVEDNNKFVALYDVEALENSEAKDVHPRNHTPWATRVRAKLPTFTERRIFRIEASYGPQGIGTAQGRLIRG